MVALEEIEVGWGVVEAVELQEIQELWDLEVVVAQILGDHKVLEVINQDQYLLAAQVLELETQDCSGIEIWKYSQARVILISWPCSLSLSKEDKPVSMLNPLR